MSTAQSKPELNSEQLSALLNQLTDEEKKGNMGKIASYIDSALKSGLSIMKVVDSVLALNKMKSHVGRVESLLEKLIKTTNCREDIIKEAQEFHTKNCTGVMDNFDFGPHIELTRLDMPNDIDEGENIKTQILNVLKDQQRQASDNLILKMTKVNCVAATIQLMKIYMAWKTISAASNVIKDKNKFTLINKNLQRMESMVMELVEICETQPEDKSIDRRMTKINTLFTSTISKISDVEVKINGHIQRLELTADYAAVDVVSNSVTALSQGFQVWSAFGELSSPTKWLGIFNVAMHGVFGLANAAVFLISQDKLKELRKDLREAVYLRETLDDLRQQAEDAIM